MATVTETLAPHTLKLRRIFDAPRDLVWLAWTRIEMVLAWWGPPEWPAASTEQDLRPGGTWRACLKHRDGSELWQGGTYREVVAPERLVFSFKWEGNDHGDGNPVDTLVTILLSALPDGRTQLDFTQEGLKSEESVADHRIGWAGTFDRFDQWITTQERKA